MTRMLAFLLLLSACSARESPGQARLMDAIEARVALPPAAHPIANYARTYTFSHDGWVVAIYTTAVIPTVPELRLGVGERRWVANSGQLPNVIGGGCDTVHISYDPRARRFGPPACNGQIRAGRENPPPPVDRQRPGSENHVPPLQATHGILGYRSGCLFIDRPSGGETGLVLPVGVMFDGKHMVGKVTRPTGEPIVFTLGQLANLTGTVIDNPRDGRFACDTRQVLITGYF